jgi:hypothetical protein
MAEQFPNFATPHCHSSSSLDTASRPEDFAKWEAEHGTGYMTVTDHGTLAGVRKVYDLCSKKYKGKVSCIPGLEAYFRDDDCPILLGAGIAKNGDGKLADYQKYYHLTMHFLDQEAYETAVRVISRADAVAERHGKERKPLFCWADLEELGAQNVTFGSSCLIGMVQRHLAFGGKPDLAAAYYDRLRSTVKPGNFMVEVFPHICDRNWDSAVVVKFEDGAEEKFPAWKNLRTDRTYGKTAGGKARAGIKAEYLADRWSQSPEGHGCLRAVMEDRVWVDREVPKKIADVQLVEGFIANDCTAFSPDGDLQLPCNRWLVEQAEKYGDPVLVSDDSHFVYPEDKVVQDVKLLQGGAWRFHTSYHRKTSDEAWIYFRDVMKVNESAFRSWVDNSRAWADRFKGLKFKSRQSLPTKFYPEKTLAYTIELIKRHGRANWSDPVYVDRLRREIKLLHQNGTIDLLPYFFIDEEVVSLHEAHGELTGPGRGSAAGLVLAYYLDITHVDPLRFGLSMDRFLTADRIAQGKLPDIDQDLPHRDLLVSNDVREDEEEVEREVEEEEPVVEGEDGSAASDTVVVATAKPDKRGWLERRFGDCVAQISTDMSMKLRAAVLNVARITAPDRKIPPDVRQLTEAFLKAPQGVSDRDFVFGYKDGDNFVDGSITYDPALVEYTRRYPEQWAVAQKCLGINVTKSRHACLPAGENVYAKIGKRQALLPIEECDGAAVYTGQSLARMSTCAATATAKLIQQGVREVVEYKTDVGRIIRCTPDHQVLTVEGWMPIQQAFEKGVQLAKSRTKQRIAEADAATYAASRGGVLVSWGGKGVAESTWRCEKGHEWQAKAVGLLSYEYWCRTCSHQYRFHATKKNVSVERSAAKCLSTYKRYDLRKGLICDLEVADVVAAKRSSCVYCARPATGFERKRNDIGHTKENCVPACLRCNWMRGRYVSHETMLQVGQLLARIDP